VTNKLPAAPKNHEYFMHIALDQAKKAFTQGEVPIGAVVVLNGKVIAKGKNSPITKHDPTAHAEIIALKKAGAKLKNYRLNDAVLYATIEPCPMCAGACVWARVSQIVYGASDVKAGACGTLMNVAANKKLNHRIKVTGGVLAKECAQLMQDFFKSKRK